jgi:hypothetical protein
MMETEVFATCSRCVQRSQEHPNSLKNAWPVPLTTTLYLIASPLCMIE